MPGLGFLRGFRARGSGSFTSFAVPPRWLLLAVLLGGPQSIGGIGTVWAQSILSDPRPQSPDAFPNAVVEALDCLELQARLERERDAILARADSLGFAAEVAEPSERGSFLREIEIVKNRYADVGLDLLLRQEVCRTLSRDAVRTCNETISRLQSGVEKGTRDPERAAELARWVSVRERLEGALTAATVYDYPVLPTDEDETVETIQLKIQYYEEVVGLLRALEDRIEVRLDSVRESAEALRDAWQFLEDLSFADMGDPNPGRDGLHPVDPSGSDPASRPDAGISMGRSSAELDFALSGSPVGPEQAETWIRVLEDRRDAVRSALGVMEEQLRSHRERVAPENR